MLKKWLYSVFLVLLFFGVGQSFAFEKEARGTELVDSWKKLDELGPDIPSAISFDLRIETKKLDELGSLISTVKQKFALTGIPPSWFDDLSEALLQKLKGIPSNQIDDFAGDLNAIENAIKQKPELVDSWKKLDDLGETALKTDVDWLKRVDDWDGAGVQLSKNGDNLKLSDGSGNALGEFKKGELIPETGKYANSGTPKGDVVNGYQVVDNGGQLGIKRVPDKSSYNSSQINDLTQHPNAHTLERHGHDVSDEALIKRANDGVAPDGSTIGSNPPYPKPAYSSKFDDSDLLKEALNDTKPGTPAFNNATTTHGGMRKKVILDSGGAVKYGRGVKRDTRVFEDMYRVEAKYELVNGKWELASMHPIK